MKANELRIGNYVNTGNFHLPKYRGNYQVKEEWFKWSSKFKPIPLTEEWLLKMGFVVTETKAGIECFYFGKRYSVFQPANTKVWLLVDGEKGLCETKHIHQLQNLYFALTGCELEIK